MCGKILADLKNLVLILLADADSPSFLAIVLFVIPKSNSIVKDQYKVSWLPLTAL
jgi:hypothetical protein